MLASLFAVPNEKQSNQCHSLRANFAAITAGARWTPTPSFNESPPLGFILCQKKHNDFIKALLCQMVKKRHVTCVWLRQISENCVLPIVLRVGPCQHLHHVAPLLSKLAQLCTTGPSSLAKGKYSLTPNENPRGVLPPAGSRPVGSHGPPS